MKNERLLQLALSVIAVLLVAFLIYSLSSGPQERQNRYESNKIAQPIDSPYAATAFTFSGKLAENRTESYANNGARCYA